MGVVSVNYLQVLLPLIYIVPGLVAPLIIGRHLAKPDMVFPTLVQQLLPAGLAGLVMAGLIAAIMSHLSGAVNSCTTIATVDFYLPYINKKATDRQAVRFGRVTGAVVFTVAMIWAILMMGKQDTPVFLYLLNVYGVFTPGIATMFLLGNLLEAHDPIGRAGGRTADRSPHPVSRLDDRRPQNPLSDCSAIARR